MTKPATGARLAGRLAACMVLGMAVTSAIAVWDASHLPPGPKGPLFSASFLWSMALFSAIMLGVPTYGLALLVLYTCRPSVLDRPVIWCLGVPLAISLFVAITSYPLRVETLVTTFVIPIGAWVAGGAFLLWHRLRPLQLPA